MEGQMVSMTRWENEQDWEVLVGTVSHKTSLLYHICQTKVFSDVNCMTIYLITFL